MIRVKIRTSERTFESPVYEQFRDGFNVWFYIYDGCGWMWVCPDKPGIEITPIDEPKKTMFISEEGMFYEL